jgi:hypothetical protein
LRTVVAAAVLVSPLAAQAGPRAAVLVGANRSTAGRGALQHAYQDAHRMAEVLVSVGGFPPGQVTVLEDPRRAPAATGPRR